MSDDLAQAAFDGDLQQVARLLDAGADINQDGRNWNPLHAAIENANLACVELLIRRGADIEHRAPGDMSPLAHAVDIAIDGTIQNGGNLGEDPTDVVRLLLKAGADPQSALKVARAYGAKKMLELLTA